MKIVTLFQNGSRWLLRLSTAKCAILPSMYFVYIMRCRDGSLYTGITTNVERRFAEHTSGVGGHYTSAKQVVKIVYTEQYPDRSFASRRESEIKGWRREKKLHLIKSFQPV